MSRSLTAREYRLIPLDEEFDKNRKDAVSLQELYHTLLYHKKLVRRFFIAFVVLGLLAAIFTPNYYESEAVLMPEMKSQSGDAGNLLQSYGGFLGLGDIGSLGSSQEGVISPQVYPMIIQSPAFLDIILSDSLYFSERDTVLTGYEYFDNLYRPSFFELVGEYTVKLPSKFSPTQYPPSLPEWAREKMELESPIQLSDQKLKTVDRLSSQIDVELNIESGVLNVQVVMPDRAAAAQIIGNVINHLKHFVEEYSTQKAKEDLKFAEIQFEQARQYFEEKQEELATFLDQNSNISSARVRSREQKLQAEFDIAYNRYQNVSDKLLEAQVNVQEHTPVFKTIQELNVPATASGPNRPAIVILLAVIGLFLSFIVIAVADLLTKIRQKINS